MSNIFLILPDFLIILIGAFLAFKLGYPQTFWQWAERLVFYVLFPPLLFTSIANSNISLSSASQFLAVAVAGMLMAVVIAWCVRYVVKDNDWTHASIFQCGFRFNTYIGFAVVSRLFGQEGLALMALLIAFWVPISNTIAVSVLANAVAKKESSSVKTRSWLTTVKAIIKNPLIIATTLGLLANLTGIKPTGPVALLLNHLGSASLAMGLLCIGAGLRLSDIKTRALLIGASVMDRLIAVPLIMWALCTLFGLSAVETGAALVFAMLPTAQSCYVMTASMRGDAPMVANVTTAQTLLCMVTIPLWIAFVLNDLAAML